MKSRTSFFNVTVLRKNLTRFAPLWALFAVAEVLGLLTLDLGSARIVANDLNYIMGPVAVFHMVYAMIVAACLFGDLFDSRLCNGLHAMPMRREGWLLTNLASGFLFALIPAVVGGTVAAIALREYFWIALVWQATSLLQFVFFFGVAVFSALCAGKRLSMIAIYALINFLSMLVFWLATLVYQPLLPGVVMSEKSFSQFCPVISMMSHRYMDFYYDKILGGFFRGFMTQDWMYLYICCGLGILFMGFAWALYRRRNLETAGDFISFRPIKTVFLLAYTLTMGTLVYAFSGVFFGVVSGISSGYLFLAVGILIGWFTGWMLLERTVKIFTKKVLLSFGVFAVAFAGSVGLTILDPLGITQYIPQTQDVEFACLYPFSSSYHYTSDYDNRGGRYITDPEEIALVQNLHRDMINSQDDTTGEQMSVSVMYRLETGRMVLRSYQIPVESQTAESLRPFFSDLRSVFDINDWNEVKDTLEMGIVYWHNDEGDKRTQIFLPEEKTALLEALEADSEAGLLAQSDWYHGMNGSVASLDITWRSADQDGIIRARTEFITIYADSVNTCAFLETLDEN